MTGDQMQTFREQLGEVAKTILAKGKAKGWRPSYVTFGEGDKASMTVTSTNTEGETYTFYATCEYGTCTVNDLTVYEPKPSTVEMTTAG
jgi:hypothetical protein